LPTTAGSPPRHSPQALSFCALGSESTIYLIPVSEGLFRLRACTMNQPATGILTSGSAPRYEGAIRSPSDLLGLELLKSQGRNRISSLQSASPYPCANFRRRPPDQRRLLSRFALRHCPPPQCELETLGHPVSRRQPTRPKHHRKGGAISLPFTIRPATALSWCVGPAYSGALLSFYTAMPALPEVSATSGYARVSTVSARSTRTSDASSANARGQRPRRDAPRLYA